MKKIKTLKKNYEFDHVLNQGKFHIGKQITIYITKNREEENRIGIAISSKKYNAVKRNFLKRKIRENYRLLERQLATGYNIVFLWNKKVPVEEADFFLIQKDMKDSFSRAGILIK